MTAVTRRPDFPDPRRRPVAAPSPRWPLQRAAVVAGVGVALTLAQVPPSWAGTLVGDGTTPDEGLTAWQTIALYVAAPVLLAAVIAVLVMAPSWVRGPRYRPTLTWWAAPVWFNAPPGQPDAGAAPDEGLRTTPATTDGGGASARW